MFVIVLMVEVLQTALIKFFTFSCLGCHCLCTSVFVIVLMVEVLQTALVRAFAHGAMDHQIDPSWWTQWAISRSSQCSMTSVKKAVVCVILSVG